MLGAFLLFACTNVIPMFRAQATLKALHGQLPGEARDMFKIWSPWVVAVVHLVMDAFVALFVIIRDKWFLGH